MRCSGGKYSAGSEEQDKQDKVRGYLKMTVMKGDATFTDVLACSLYDTNPVQIMSTVANSSKCNPIKKKVYGKIEKKNVDIHFHRLNGIHKYDFGMG